MRAGEDFGKEEKGRMTAKEERNRKETEKEGSQTALAVWKIQEHIQRQSYAYRFHRDFTTIVNDTRFATTATQCKHIRRQMKNTILHNEMSSNEMERSLHITHTNNHVYFDRKYSMGHIQYHIHLSYEMDLNTQTLQFFRMDFDSSTATTAQKKV